MASIVTLAIMSLSAVGLDPADAGRIDRAKRVAAAAINSRNSAISSYVKSRA